ncbi:MAG: FkbM family methyltransferase [Flavobacteriales bacterium]|nr:FkbM family methyltransferase [Flavobacteriales bacterium]
MKLTSYLFKTIVKTHNLNPFKRAFCKLLKFLNFPKEKVFKDINFKGKFKVCFDNKKFFINHFGDTISKHIFWNGLFKTWENDTGWIWKELCEKSNNIFDIGANTGVYSLVAKTINKQSKVFAFEPSINTFKQLQKNNKINNYDIVCEKIALSNKSENQVFYDTPYQNQTSASLSPEKLKNWEGYKGNIVEYDVATLKLDDFIKLNKIKKIDLIKLDVEMHEAEVIEGFKEFLGKFKPIIIIEVLETSVAEKLNSLFDLKEYLIFHLYGFKQVKEVKQFSPKLPFYNFLIFHKDVEERVRKNTSLFENLK